MPDRPSSERWEILVCPECGACAPGLHRRGCGLFGHRVTSGMPYGVVPVSVLDRLIEAGEKLRAIRPLMTPDETMSAGDARQAWDAAVREAQGE